MNNRAELGTLIARVVLGFTFFVHGYMKFQGGIANAAGFFNKIGIPGMLAYGVGVIELVGGICVLLGIGTRIFSVAFAGIMVGAITMAKLSAGFAGGYELEVALLAMSVHQALSGEQKLALGRYFVRGRNAKQSV
ncbi:DoxX family protein [Paenibacillus sp. NPDC056579]|uniref:DoxX family protein n=1 Tax=unclassified Paenibacillus TaxID=185978 RepID=UPI001EF95E63|nr:DoxX family protein [Paenibacillus sp. H1-7]